MADINTLAPETAGRSSVIYNGIETPALAPAPRPLDAPRLVCLGRIVRDKGFDVALAAFAELAPRFPEARLVVAGDGPARPELEAQAQALGVADAVEFPGWVAPERVSELMNSATLVVMPSRWDEPFGLVAVEAALMARPVVASRVGGLMDVVEDQRTGLLVPPEDPDALAAALRWLLSDCELRARLGRAGADCIAQRFGVDAMTDAYERLCREVLVEGGPR